MKIKYFHFKNDTSPCKCGKIHKKTDIKVYIGKNAVNSIIEVLKDFNVKKPLIIAKESFLKYDGNGPKASGVIVRELLENEGVEYATYTFPDSMVKCDEHTAGSAFIKFNTSCDCIIGIGSGVINDIGKLLSSRTKLPYIIVGTAPSMDGYASATSSLEVDGLKTHVRSKSPDVIIGDTDILKTAPDIMVCAGFGDLLAKYTSLAEWKISNIITGEHYCEDIAQLERSALDKCTAGVQGLAKREDEAIEDLFEALIRSGVAMNILGNSRPASGTEHCMSHVWDIRGLVFGTPVAPHGIQCAITTVISSKMYEKLKDLTPDREKALASVASFDNEKWNKHLEEFIGKGSKVMIEAGKKNPRYDVESHKARLEVIIENWDKIVSIIKEEIPSSKHIEELLDLINCPKDMTQIGLDQEILPDTFRAAADIRDKYVLSRLTFDLGITDELLK